MYQSASQNDILCPVCGKLVPVNPEYVSWCDCGWNIRPSGDPKPNNIMESIFINLGNKSGKILFEKISSSGSHKPTMTISKIAAYLMAGIINVINLISIFAGLVFVVKAGKNVFAYLIGIVLICAGWISRPRFPKVRGEILPKDEFPNIYRIVNLIAERMGVAIDGIVIDLGFNASLAKVGFRWKNFLYLGLPLLTVLNHEERVALISHELAHAINNDGARSFFISIAIRTLSNWHDILMPERILESSGGITDLLMIPYNLFIFGCAKFIWLWAYLLSLLLWRESQRAEYYADMLAIQMSGKDGMISMLDKLHFSEAFRFSVQKKALNPDLNFWDLLKKNLFEMPDREKERIRRLEQLEGSKLDASHPPTIFRINLAKKMEGREAGFRMSDFESKQIDAEMSSLGKKIEKTLVDSYFTSIYY